MWEETLYFNLLEIECSEEIATVKRKELGNYMRRRYREYQAAKPAKPAEKTDSIPNQ